MLVFLLGWFLCGETFFGLLKLVERGGTSSIDEIEELNMVVAMGAA
ncbi:MAG: hypothetical protein Q6367_012240 [Candidatus Freyarchaeota archaeon]